MAPIANIPDSSFPRVVIIGGGFAGMRLALELSKKQFEVVLIDRNNFHQFQPLYYQVATAGLEPSSISFPMRKAFQKFKHTHFRMAEFLKACPEKNEIETSIGNVRYDYLVFAIGADTNYFGREDMIRAGLPMKSVGEALRIRNTILEHFERALNTDDPAEQSKLINIVIVGGGATGVELAGALSEMKRFVLPKDYPELDFSRMGIYLIEASERLLAAMSPKSSATVEKYLIKMGVNVHTSTKVLSFESNKVKTDKTPDISAEMVLWTAGISVPKVEGIDKAEVLRGGRLKVNRFNQLLPYENIFAIGDMALMTEPDYPNGHPQVAPPAIQQASLLASNLDKLVSGKKMKEFHYQHKGSMATVGRNRAVAELGKIHIRGFVAWAFWLFVHLMSIVGSKNRVFIFMNWMWNYLSYDQSLRLIIKPSKRKIS
ncbi:MAG: NAD(P)/FAD-dependent oxidoreductase [Bacteroidales bacterium]|nr:NAD(P)/FAD-dependent oxidoreductase [Bacteroidales bacterium]MCB8998904.1 NAD(P)/FAD-dependent oxidoreductase [Bacteroidales bacterium]